jgi:hypothetical protein
MRDRFGPLGDEPLEVIMVVMSLTRSRVELVEMGAQALAAAVDPGADRSERDPEGVSDLQLVQVRPGKEQQSVPVGRWNRL